MAKASNQVNIFRIRINDLLTAFERAQAAAQTLDYLGGQGFYGSELDKVDGATPPAPVYDITKAQFGNAIAALTAIKTLPEADNQVHGKALARMRE